ncbi:TPA: S8 family peptidase [Yersinia enterocolitica]|nr:S8 family peptidase [Yersinia enterocolitica]
MNNNPIQIVLNTSDYIDSPVPEANGNNKDFYPNKDEAFKTHKMDILGSVIELQELLASKENHTTFAHVILKPAAWAKSHRPIRSVFKSKKVPYIGGGDIGEMIVEINDENINDIISSIEKAEEFTRETLNPKTNKIEFKPSRSRSEVGAISEIRVHDESDKRDFSIESAFKWMQNPETGKVYFIELFSLHKEQQGILSKIDILHEDFESLLNLLPVESKRFSRTGKNNGSVFYVISLSYEDNKSIELHKTIIEVLEKQDVVKKIYLPPIITVSQDTSIEQVLKVPVEFPIDMDIDYPVVGIVDTGVSPLKNLESWREGGTDFIASTTQDRSHGTFIAGLISAGNTLNPTITGLNEIPCKFYDLDLYPTNKTEFSANYPKGFIDFLRQLDAEVVEAKANGVRVFNMSLSLITPVDNDSYSFYASMIDDICDSNDVIFVLPAGNLSQHLIREDWPALHTDALSMLAKYRYQGKDRILQPCESIRAISVGALDTSNDEKFVKPARYTRRGPGPSLGVKPDVCHIGGTFGEDTGLYSLSPSGNLVSGCGTSYAAPLVAKTLAILDKQIEGYVPRETLYGLLVHHAKTPERLDKKELKEISRDFVGFGLPPVANDIVLYDDSSITLVFNGNFTHPYNELAFDFIWPKSLTDEEGKCRGDVALTLVYSPYCDNRFGNEFIRLNLDVCLRQAIENKETGEIIFRGVPKDSLKSSHEEELIKNGLKWWPTKKFNWRFKGRGTSSSWRVVVESLLRSDVNFPSSGIPFSVLLTITDPKKGGYVFNEVRTALISSGVKISDIRTSNIVRARG